MSLYKFQLIHRLGVGSSGEVWLANDTALAKEVALKIISHDCADGLDAIVASLKEARIGNKFTHQNIVTMRYADFFQTQNTRCVLIAMDYHKNGSITSKVNSSNFLPLNKLLHILIDILRGLEYLHECHFYHNDIKPQNILVGSNGEGLLTDYGISCFSPTLQPACAKSFYKLHAPPEMVSSRVADITTDIYQVGMTAFRLLNGISSLESAYNKHGEDKYNQLASQGKLIQSCGYLPFVPKGLKSILNKATDPDPKERFLSCLDMRRALERLNYIGYWTTNPNGEYIGFQEGYEYRFIVNQVPNRSCHFDAFTKITASSREFRIPAFCEKHITIKKREHLQKKFMQWVVVGDKRRR
jgi:serine/threonine protein kinase